MEKPRSVPLSYTCLDKKIFKKSLLCAHIHQLHLKLLNNKNFLVVVQSLSCVRLFVTPWVAVCQASLSFTISQSLLKLMSIESVIPSNHLVLCRPLLLLPSIFPSSSVFSNESTLCIRWPKYWSFSNGNCCQFHLQKTMMGKEACPLKLVNYSSFPTSCKTQWHTTIGNHFPLIHR